MRLSAAVHAERVGLEQLLLPAITDERVIIGHQGEFLENVLMPVIAGSRLSHEASH
jgi:hypothetical protein